MKKTLIFLMIISIFAIGLSACTINTSSAPLSVTKVESEVSTHLDEKQSERILTLFKDGKWINDAPNCAYDYLFDYNGDIYRYHSDCGTFYSMTDKQSLELNESMQNEVNDILTSLFK